MGSSPTRPTTPDLGFPGLRSLRSFSLVAVVVAFRRRWALTLSGGRMTSGIVRRGDWLLRPMGPWSAAVHEYLRHLEAAGFEGSPRVLGIEGDREVLTLIDGDVAVDPRWQPGHGHRLPPYARTELADLPARLRMFLDPYGLTDRKAILPALQRCKLDEPEQLRWFQDISPSLARTL